MRILTKFIYAKSSSWYNLRVKKEIPLDELTRLASLEIILLALPLEQTGLRDL